jgi:valyl-tRNA synthetase
MLDKTYDAAAIEPRISAVWDEARAFRAGAGAEPGAKTFTIVIPPPNVTGSLHMGHALNNTLQDVLCRFERMRGRDVLWQPGMDHAGIATQMVVERQLAESGETRRSLGREAFVRRVWAWKEQSGGSIQNQLKRLGASCDWSRERFTMDEGLSQAVLEVFVTLHEQGLIYRDKRLVNWDPKFQTAISDLEVLPVEVKGKLWHFRYPIEGRAFDPENPASFVVVATTRPETMLGDTAVAVHPDDERYRDLVEGQAHLVLPLVGRRIPLVADTYSDPEKGTGAVKITPAHDFNDFEVGRRHGLRQISVLDAEARMLLDGNKMFHDGLPETDALTEVVALHGVDRFEARKRVVEMMDAGGFLAKVEDHVHVVPHGDRSNVVIEPFLTDQWYVDAKTLAAPALEAVRDGRTVFVPKTWEKTYFEWMENIQPWCVSRQLWWGHQIPAWYGPDIGADGSVQFDLVTRADPAKSAHQQIFVERSEAAAIAAAEKRYGRPVRIVERRADAIAMLLKDDDAVGIWRDPDVLDTWFSSALWPFSTLGWPEQTPELARYYPTSVLVTGFDIIFFWVARMMMAGLHFMKEVPFDTVYIHALVRDEKGAKMSKSKGNVIDPLDLMTEYGADALRFTLAAMAAQGRDIKLSTARVAGYRSFATKLWNAARFAEMNGCARVDGFDPAGAATTLGRWIVAETGRTTAEVTAALEAFRFNEAAAAVYRFTWNTFCDWYVELAKPTLLGADGADKDEIRAVTAWALDQILKILHPFMPFVTEELWERIGEVGPTRAEPMLAHARWPTLTGEGNAAADEINWLIDLISAIRSVRVETNVPGGAMVPLVVVGADAETRRRFAANDAEIKRLARIDAITLADTAPPKSAQIVIGATVACLPLVGIIDLDAERLRLQKELGKIDADIARVDAKLSKPDFIARAPEEVVEGEREKREEAVQRRAKVVEALERLSGG